MEQLHSEHPQPDNTVNMYFRKWLKRNHKIDSKIIYLSLSNIVKWPIFVIINVKWTRYVNNTKPILVSPNINKDQWNIQQVLLWQTSINVSTNLQHKLLILPTQILAVIQFVMTRTKKRFLAFLIWKIHN